MSTPANFIKDGTPPSGTTTITTSEAVTYIVNNETITPTWDEASNRTATGGPNQLLLVKGRYKYSGEWQLASSSTTYPTPGATFTRAVPQEAATVTFVVAGTPFEYTNEVQIRVAKVEGWQAIGTITTG